MPLNYQLEEVDSEKMILQPIQTVSDLRTTQPMPKMSTNFAYLSQQISTKTTGTGIRVAAAPGPKKTSGNKHLELQKALKAQYSSRVAEKRQSQKSPIKEYFADKQDRRKSHERNMLTPVQDSIQT